MAVGSIWKVMAVEYGNKICKACKISKKSLLIKSSSKRNQEKGEPTQKLYGGVGVICAKQKTKKIENKKTWASLWG